MKTNKIPKYKQCKGIKYYNYLLFGNILKKK